MVWKTKTEGKRKRGRLKEKWDSVVGKILLKTGKNWADDKNLAHDRKEWNSSIKN